MGNSANAKHYNNPRFVQPIIPQNLTSFSIPLSFKEKLEEEGYEIIDKVVLVDEIESRNRDFDCEWEVEIERGCCFREGWKKFCEDHNLTVGDFLVFTHLGNLVFHVSVYDPATGCQRFLQKGTSNYDSTRTRKLVEVEDATPETPSVKSLYSNCDVTMTTYSLNRADITLPMSFVRSNGLFQRRCQVELIDEKGKSWEVELNYKKCSNRSFIVAQGWKVFQARKNLKHGDIIHFEFLKGGKRPTMKCYRTSNCSSRSTHRRKPVEAEPATTEIPSAESKYPSFDATVTNYSLKKPVIHLPISFVRSNGLFKRRCQMELVDGKGKSWQAKQNYKKSSGQHYIFVRGWKYFQDRNSLNPGNFIRFELLSNGEKPIMKCYRLTGRKSRDHSR